ncbi:MAG: (Fe-S)-binding protein, partial [Peptococcaceae bacterium]
MTATKIEQSKLDRWERELSKCIRCGTCRQFCPIHQVLDDESFTARGKLYLIDQFIHGDFLLSDGFVEMISKCVMCKACTSNCPSGVNTYQLFMEMREEIVKERGLSFTKQSIFRALHWRKFFDFGLSCGSLFQRLIFKPAPDGHGQVARVPLPMAGFNQRRIIPNLPRKHLKQLVPQVSQAKGRERCKVAFFTGCMLNYVYPQIGQDLVDVLNLNGVTVITPREQHCCSTPLFTSGETEISTDMIHHNLQIFGKLDVDYIVTGCGSCGLAWKQEFAKVLGEGHADYGLALELGKKTRDISEFLVMLGIDTSLMQESVQKKITYHDSCHLNRGQKVHDQPRQLLQALPGGTYIEMEKADSCCGSGGSFNLKYYELSRQINRQKTERIAQSGADVVAVGCPACLMHIKDGLAQDGIAVETKHVIELIAESYGLHQQRKEEGHG